jgi:Cu+-exporting ATPase
MQVDEKNAAGRSEYQGQTYYFCSENCKERFDQNPQQYVKQGAQGAGRSA